MAQVFDFQLELFETKEEREIRFLAEHTKASLNRVRKGTYARLNRQQRELDELSERLTIIERNICRPR